MSLCESVYKECVLFEPLHVEKGSLQHVVPSRLELRVVCQNGKKKH